jgi:hypothetical protein
MNERIQQLAEQAFFDESTSRPSTKMYTFSEHKMEKFAELIVQECIHALWTEECRTNAMTQAEYERGGNRIHKHFWD